MKNTEVNVYESNAGTIHAIITDGECIINILGGFENGFMSTTDFIADAQDGFVFADDFNSDDYCGCSIEDVAAEIIHESDLIATITADRIELNTERMGTAGRVLFSVTKN